MERELDPKKIIKTSGELATWVNNEFAGTHLAKIANEVNSFAQQAVDRAARIRRPAWFIRFAVVSLLLALIGGGIYEIIVLKIGAHDILKFSQEQKGNAAYVVAALVILFTLETRWKRRKALQAIGSLRAMVHIVDMHQLSKDQFLVPFKENWPQEKLIHYLHACTAMLAILSKIGEVYVEHFPDEVAIEAVNNFEMVTAGLADKIWMKIGCMKWPCDVSTYLIR